MSSTMSRLKEAQEALPGWEVVVTHLRDGILEAIQPGTGISVKAGTVEDLVASVRAVVRIQEVARVLFGPHPLALSDEHWPHTRKIVGRIGENLWYHHKPPVGVPPTRAQMDLVLEAQKAIVSAPPPRVVRDTPKPSERPSMTAAVRRELDAKAKGYTGIPCDQCGSLETVRIGKCLRCESCGSSGECG